MIYFLHGLGVFLGVLAGTFVTILTQLYFAKRGQTQQTQNLKFELELNVSKIDTWLEELEKYRHAVNGDALHNWFGYFDIGKGVSVTANAMFASGLLYNVLDKDDIAALQQLFTDLSPDGEQYMNNQLGESRRNFTSLRHEGRMNEWHQTYKPDAVDKANFWEKRFCDHQRKLEEIIGKL